ncbi:carbohydrate ABC transporter permease [Saccharospirillum mangrovi]|uniref:carbohydrate ABC transporter permease n=1 Tax=Saccharospirillum mangrovi TaxID=2161747 RepID=UPI000D388AEA|nr:carbohydrate ABC transporter permease [Saccharospirillum mangrovi]
MDMRRAKIVKNVSVTIGAWLVALLIFFPIFWMVLTSLKTELNAFSTPPSLFFMPTLENYLVVFERSDYLKYFWNSVVISFGSSIIGMLIAVPGAYAMAFYPTARTKDLLLWMLSTKMLPPVGVLVPIYLLFRDTHLLDSKIGLVIIFTLINLPIIIWMVYTYFREVPKDILEAVRMDGAHVWGEIRHVLLPISLGGLSSTFLLSLILSWNEAFWSLNLTTSSAAPLTALIASYSSPEGLFWAKLSAASTLAVAPILIFGWISQKQLVRGLTFGAVK